MKKVTGRKILELFLFLLFAAYLGEISLFTHTHVVNGVTIVHSHPFKDAEHHSTTELITISVLTAFEATGSTVSYIIEAPDIHGHMPAACTGDQDVPARDISRGTALRAPPAMG